MSPELNEINRTIKALLAEAVPNKHDGGISYLLHHIRNDVYVPIEISQTQCLAASEYYLAFSRLSKTDCEIHEVRKLDAAIPVLLKQGRVESLCFRGCQHTSFWQELIPLSADNRLVLVRASYKDFNRVPLSARRFAFPGYNLTHSIWEKAGAAFLASQNLSAGNNTCCNELVEHLARHLADEYPLPPFFDLVNFHLEVKAAHDVTACRLTRCNPLGFTSGVVVDYSPGEWPWIPEMVKKGAKGTYVQHIPTDHPDALSDIKSALYRSIVENTHDLVVKVSEYDAPGARWWFFARHNRKKDREETEFIKAIPTTMVCSCPYQAVASIIERQTIEKDHLVTLWALNPDTPTESSLAVGSRVEKSRFPEILASIDAAAVKDNTISANLSSADEFVRIAIQPRTGCSETDVDSLRTSLQEICDATFAKVRLLAPMERLKSHYRNILNTRNQHGDNVWNALFFGEGKHKATEFRANAQEADWEALCAALTSSLKPFSSEILKLWECFSSYDARFKGLYLNAAKSFAQRSLSPEICVMLGGGSIVTFPVKGYLSLHTTDEAHAEKQACELAAGLLLLSKENFRLADAELSMNSITGPRMYPLLRLRFESKQPNPRDVFPGTNPQEAHGSEEVPNGFSLSDIQSFNRTCFDELPPDQFGKGRKNELRTALQLIRGHAIAYSIGFFVIRKKLVPTICIELECVEAP